MRALVAACAACISSICVHPIDTIYIKKQLQSTQKIVNPMAGCKYSACSNFLTTGMYFYAYERMLKICPDPIKLPLSTFVGVSVSGIVATPLSVLKKRKQAYSNKLSIVNDIKMYDWIKLYTINILSKYPKSFVKYSIYEPLLIILSGTYTMTLSAFISSLVSALLASIIFEPIEYTRTFQSLGIKKPINKIYSGLRFGIMSSILGNVIGHSILETIAPRS